VAFIARHLVAGRVVGRFGKSEGWLGRCRGTPLCLKELMERMVTQALAPHSSICTPPASVTRR
jgi:hypothetical protein